MYCLKPPIKEPPEGMYMYIHLYIQDENLFILGTLFLNHLLGNIFLFFIVWHVATWKWYLSVSALFPCKANGDPPNLTKPHPLSDCNCKMMRSSLVILIIRALSGKTHSQCSMYSDTVIVLFPGNWSCGMCLKPMSALTSSDIIPNIAVQH